MAYSVSSFGMWQWLLLALGFIAGGVSVAMVGEVWFGLLFIAAGILSGLFTYLTWRAIKRR